MGLANTIGSIIAILLAVLWTVMSVAHFDPQWTPELAAGIDGTTKSVHEAFSYSGLSVEQLKIVFGTLGAATAVLLWLPQTRRTGCRMAAFVTFLGRVFPQFVIDGYKSDDMALVAASAGAATVASVLLD